MGTRAACEQRSLDDESLAHVYLATARLKVGEIEGAMESVRPIMELPEERQISLLHETDRRPGRPSRRRPVPGSTSATDARDELRTSTTRRFRDQGVPHGHRG